MKCACYSLTNPLLWPPIYKYSPYTCILSTIVLLLNTCCACTPVTCTVTVQFPAACPAAIQLSAIWPTALYLIAIYPITATRLRRKRNSFAQ